MPEVPEPTGARRVRPSGSASEHSGDLNTPEAVVEALYGVLSGPAEAEQERDWALFRELVIPEARFLITRWPDANGKPVQDLREWDVDGFIEDAKRFNQAEGLWEREIWGRTDHFGNVAHRFSSYESRVGSETADPVVRGVNSFQLVRSGDRWWIASIVWDVEDPDQPIPEEYLHIRDATPTTRQPTS